jgi:hypothetical protein
MAEDEDRVPLAYAAARPVPASPLALAVQKRIEMMMTEAPAASELEGKLLSGIVRKMDRPASRRNFRLRPVELTPVERHVLIAELAEELGLRSGEIHRLRAEHEAWCVGIGRPLIAVLEGERSQARRNLVHGAPTSQIPPAVSPKGSQEGKAERPNAASIDRDAFDVRGFTATRDAAMEYWRNLLQGLPLRDH